MGSSPLSATIGGLGALAMGFLCKFRVLPFLKPDTILSGGRLVPTAEFANLMASFFFVGSAVILSIAAWLTIRAKQ